MKIHRRLSDIAGITWSRLRNAGRDWGKLWNKPGTSCGAPNCSRPRNIWSRLRRRPPIVRIQGVGYCMPVCLERVLHGAVQSSKPAVPPRGGGHRVPLGLLLLSRKQLTDWQLRSALAAQREAGRGRIGEWLQGMGFVGERQVTAALARQWSCPLWQTQTSPLKAVVAPQIPVLLLNLFHMVPVSFISATATLHMAFADGIDYSALYAIEQMLDCRTQPCLVAPSLLRERLFTFGNRAPTDFVFDRVSSVSELAGIVSNYAVRVSAREIRLAYCRSYTWVRILCASGQVLNLLLRIPANSSTGLADFSFDAGSSL